VKTDYSTQLDALGDSTRRAILARLVKGGPLPVGELARDFPISRPAISQHLRVLKRAKLVTDESEGTRRLYAVNPEALASLRSYFERFWSEALAGFKRRVEAQAKKKR
jgi:DNA-binding transcriptional ArsR family regulator